MKMDDLKEIFARLNRELQRSNDVGSDSEQAVHDLNQHLQQLKTPRESDVDFLLDRAKELETRFAAEHPVLERLAREFVDAVAKMGV
jgi:ABC-type transporter Mla subunit MlaD